jgi:hypothetical protein
MPKEVIEQFLADNANLIQNMNGSQDDNLDDGDIMFG